MDRTTAANYATVGGKRQFQDADPGAGISIGTDLAAADHTAWQEEIMGVIEGAGLTGDAANLKQMLAAINRLSVPLAHTGISGGSTNGGAGSLSTSASFTPPANGIIHITGFGGAGATTTSASLTVTGGTVTSGGAIDVSTGGAGPGLAGFNAVASVTSGVSVSMTVSVSAPGSTTGSLNFVFVFLPTS